MKALESRIGVLVREYETLKTEHLALKARYAELMDERAALLNKFELARKRVETMVMHLKSLEVDQ